MTIVICTYRREEVFVTLNILCLLKEPFPMINVLVVDNHGDDRLQEFCSSIGVDYIYEERLGLSNGRNAGLERTKGDWVYFIDDDVYVTEELLEALSLTHCRDDILYSYVVSAVLPVIDDEFVGISLANSLSIHGKAIIPIGCSFGFYNNGDIYFDSSLGRVGRNLAGDEENAFISELVENGRRLKVLNASIVHRIGNKLNNDYIINYYKSQVLSTGSNRKMRLLFHIARSYLTRNSKTYRKSLISVYKEL